MCGRVHWSGVYWTHRAAGSVCSRLREAEKGGAKYRADCKQGRLPLWFVLRQASAQSSRNRRGDISPAPRGLTSQMYDPLFLKASRPHALSRPFKDARGEHHVLQSLQTRSESSALKAGRLSLRVPLDGRRRLPLRAESAPTERPRERPQSAQ